MNKWITQRNTMIWVLACFALASIYAPLAIAISDHAAASEQAARTRADAESRAKAAISAWTAHVERAAWDRAHPAEVARRKAADKARQVAEARAAASAAAANRAQQAREDAARKAEQARQDRLAHACDTASSYEKQAAEDDTSGDHQGAYNNAVSGLTYNALCEDDTSQLINQGYLLSMKGLAEHYISSGDSRTDLNQANALLEECVTKPGLYGTATGAGCETQMQNNIQSTTNWDMEN